MLARRPSSIPRVRIRYLMNTDICICYNAVDFIMEKNVTVEYGDLNAFTCVRDILLPYSCYFNSYGHTFYEQLMPGELILVAENLKSRCFVCFFKKFKMNLNWEMLVDRKIRIFCFHISCVGNTKFNMSRYINLPFTRVDVKVCLSFKVKT